MTDEVREFARRAGAPVYAVGGWVRDRIEIALNEFGRECGENRILSFLGTSDFGGDFDVCGPLDSDELRARLGSGYEVQSVNPRLGTALVRGKGFRAEYTPFREETYPAGGAHAPIAVGFVAELEADARRRDFRCNAIYYDLANGTLVDPLGGLRDLRARRLAVVGPDTLAHDGLRLLRLVRFCASLGYSIDRDTRSLAARQRSLLQDIPSERIAAELKKTFVPHREGNLDAAKLIEEIKLFEPLGGVSSSFASVAKSRAFPYEAFCYDLCGRDCRRLNALRIAFSVSERNLLRALCEASEETLDPIFVADRIEIDVYARDFFGGERGARWLRESDRIRSLGYDRPLAYRGGAFLKDHPELPKEKISAALARLRSAAILSGVPNETEALKACWRERCE